MKRYPRQVVANVTSSDVQRDTKIQPSRSWSNALYLLIGTVLGVSLATLLSELRGIGFGAATPEPRALQTQTLEAVLQSDERELTSLRPVDLDWLAVRSLLDEEPDRGEAMAVLDEWIRLARSRAPVPLNLLAGIDEERARAHWQHLLAALQTEAGFRFDPSAPRPERPEDQFLTAALPTRRITSATLAMWLVTLGRGLGEPVDLIVVGERLLCRLTLSHGVHMILDVGERGVETPDKHGLIDAASIPLTAVRSGSELTPLSHRELAAWLLARRARVLRYRGQLARADGDLLGARQVLPSNRSLFLQMVQLLDHRGPEVLGETAWNVFASKRRHESSLASTRATIPKTAEEVMRFNEATRKKPSALSYQPSAKRRTSHHR